MSDIPVPEWAARALDERDEARARVAELEAEVKAQDEARVRAATRVRVLEAEIERLMYGMEAAAERWRAAKHRKEADR